MTRETTQITINRLSGERDEEREKRITAEAFAKKAAQETVEALNDLKALRERARADMNAMKAEIASLTETVATQRGYIQALVETEALANGITEPVNPAPSPQPFRRNPEAIYYGAPRSDFMEPESYSFGHTEQARPKRWFER